MTWSMSQQGKQSLGWRILVKKTKSGAWREADSCIMELVKNLSTDAENQTALPGLLDQRLLTKLLTRVLGKTDVGIRE